MIVFDLDGTLADCEHRRHFVTAPKESKYIFTDSIPHKNGCILTGEYRFKCGKKWKPDWQAFYEACDKDKPIYPVIEIYKQLNWESQERMGSVQIWSGRCESVRPKTNTWLMKHGIADLTILKNLKMRPIGDNTPDEILKERWLDEYIETKFPKLPSACINFVFDDRKKVVDMWRRRGIFVFDVSQGKGDF
jgi:hypothetical protein